MGVYIPKMEMPRACYYCHFLFRDKRHNKVYCTVHHEFDKWLDISDAPAEGRADDCPLVELPPHGDLIDHNALKLAVLEETYNTEDGVLIVMKKIFDKINNAPIVIESEDGDG